MPVTDTAPPDPACRFALLIEGLQAAAAAEGDIGFVPLALISLIWRRLRRIAVGVAALFARFRAGTLRAAAGAPRGPAPARAAPAAPVLPNRNAWLVPMVRGTLQWGPELEALLADPEVAAVLAAAPQLRRILRPLCRMLGVKPTQALALPPRPPPASPRRKRPSRARPYRLVQLHEWRSPCPLWPTKEVFDKFNKPIRIYER
jgi:hypothetical protein